MKFRFKPTEHLYLYSMGKRFRVTSVFTNMKDANDHMAKDTDAACIAAFGSENDERGEIIFIANRYDNGVAA